MSSQAPAYVRTGTPIVAGPVITYVAKRLGLDLSTEDVLLLVPAVSYAYYVLGRALEHFNPKLGWILGIAKQPAYSAKEPPQPEPPLAEDDDEILKQVMPEGYVPLRERNEIPVQTDNRPKDDDPADLEPEIATPIEWTGKEMR